MGFDYSWKSSSINSLYDTLSTDNTFRFKKMSLNPPNIAIENLSTSLSHRHRPPLSPSYHLTPRHPKTTPDFWTNYVHIYSLFPYYIIRPFTWT